MRSLSPDSVVPGAGDEPLPRVARRLARQKGPILPPPNDRLDTFVMASRPQWELLTRQLLGERAGIYLKIPRGGHAWAGRSVLYNIGAQGTMAIAA